MTKAAATTFLTVSDSASATNVPPAEPDPVLLAVPEIEFELRRLVSRIIDGARLLRTVRPHEGDPDKQREVLLDLEVNGVRCQLTWHADSNRGSVSRLTTREREVAHMVAMGLTNMSIATKLDLSPWTVATHLRRIFAKLNVPTRAAMVAVIADVTTAPPSMLSSADLP
jgi:DNA-binding CsgD family transcriptional regulator